jgi:D-aspartate ligase
MGSIGANGVGGTGVPDDATARTRRSRRRGHAQPGPTDFNRDVPALVLKIGQYPVQSGPVAVIRTLGRLGVPVYAMTEPGVTPAAASRYCTGRFVWRATDKDDPDVLVSSLLDCGRQIGRRSVLIPMDDESAMLVAEHAGELAEHFIFPDIAPGLPRQVASKSGLNELCQRHDVPTPASAEPANRSDALSFAASATFPLIVKNARAWDIRNPVGGTVGASSSGSVLLHRPEQVASLLRSDDGPPGLLLQEYIPAQHAEDWLVSLYSDGDANCRLLFTGLKTRSWPLGAGVTAAGIAKYNPDLAAIAERFCKELGYRGVASFDWRLDRRDGTYKLLDFNPRAGNSFRLFENDRGIDLIRALHLDLTGRVIPPGPQVDDRQLIVEHIDIPSRILSRTALRRRSELEPSMHSASGTGRLTTERGWWAPDDPLPMLAVLARPVSVLKIVKRGFHQIPDGAVGPAPGGRRSGY